MPQNVWKGRKYVRFLVCITNLFGCLPNNKGYNFCVFNICDFKEIGENEKIRSSQKITGYTAQVHWCYSYMLRLSNTSFLTLASFLQKSQTNAKIDGWNWHSWKWQEIKW